MVRAVVGGRSFDKRKEEIEDRMRGVQPEAIREHVVEMLGTVFPPKQVLATVTGWERTTFTTMEAQRVLTRAGFRCRRAGVLSDGRTAWITDDGKADSPEEQLGLSLSTEERLNRAEAALTVANQAIASLLSRLDKLEGQ